MQIPGKAIPSVIRLVPSPTYSQSCQFRIMPEALTLIARSDQSTKWRCNKCPLHNNFSEQNLRKKFLATLD
jgi:hypothetical protein